MGKLSKAFGAAKMDFAEARFYVKGAAYRARRSAKRDLKRAMRRAAKSEIATY